MELADHGVDPGPDRRGPKVGNGNRLVLGVGLEAGIFAEVLLDLFQQLHGGVCGRHPPRRAVLLDQGEPGPVDLQGGSGGFGNPQQPGQQISGVWDGRPQIPDGPGDHLMVNSHSLVPRADCDDEVMLALPSGLGNAT